MPSPSAHVCMIVIDLTIGHHYPYDTALPSSLQQLHIGSCALTRFDARWLTLTNLVVLEVRVHCGPFECVWPQICDNNFSSLLRPLDFGSLRTLRTLKMSNCRLRHVPLPPAGVFNLDLAYNAMGSIFAHAFCRLMQPAPSRDPSFAH